jgi:phytoene dehydrogenase-like protein
LRCSAGARQILTDRRGVTGVELGTGQRISAKTVVSAIDAPTAFQQLLGREGLPARFVRRLRAMDLSMSISAIYLGTDLDARALGAQHEVRSTRTWSRAAGIKQACIPSDAAEAADSRAPGQRETTRQTKATNASHVGLAQRD